MSRKDQPEATLDASLQIEAASPADMPFIEGCIERFRLDGEDLRVEQFIVARQGGRILAFGRIKPYKAVYELGCVGVLETHRGRGLGKLMVRELIRRFPTRQVYITTDIPAYFERLGFRRIETGPPEIFEKIERVCGALRSGVVAMVYCKEG